MRVAVESKRRKRRPRSLPGALDRRFEAVVFDWDGTAVPDRQADATPLRHLLEELCALGLEAAVVTGTHVDNVDRQLRASLTRMASWRARIRWEGTASTRTNSFVGWQSTSSPAISW